jgi:hypothetical protein
LRRANDNAHKIEDIQVDIDKAIDNLSKLKVSWSKIDKEYELKVANSIPEVEKLAEDNNGEI